MKKIFRNGLFMFAAGMIATSCADYNVTDNFKADPDPSYKENPYKDLAPVKSYMDKVTYPNMTLGATVKVKDFNKQELIHAAAVSNFDEISLGSSLTSGTIVGKKGVMNFLDMIDFISNGQKVDCKFYGSPLFANTGQADEWLDYVTAPVEVAVSKKELKSVDFSTMDKFEGVCNTYLNKPTGTIEKYDNKKVLKVGITGKVQIVADFELHPGSLYEIIYHVKTDKKVTYSATFCGETIKDEKGNQANFVCNPDDWREQKFEIKCPADATEAYFRIDNKLNGPLYITDVTVCYYPDNHREQTPEEKRENIDKAINVWCNDFMKTNNGFITTFDLIEEAIDGKNLLENQVYDLKHSTSKIYWQDIIGSENYGPQVYKEAKAAFEKHNGKAEDLRFFLAESGLEEAKKMESLLYWMGIWEKNGAKFDGINAKLNLVYSEDPQKQADNEAAYTRLLDALHATGKLIRLSNFDIKYEDADGKNVGTDVITNEQRQKLADYNARLIKAYLTKIAADKQAGICKTNISDSKDPVGLWTETKEEGWKRNAIYKAFCDGVSGK